MAVMGPEQLSLLIDTRGPALVLFARQWCGSAEDVVQAAFLKLAGQRPVPADPVPWLYQAVRNAALAAARAERRRRHHEGRAAVSVDAWFAPAETAGLDAATAAEALARLTLDEREVIVAHLWGGLSFELIGPLIGASTAVMRVG